MGPMMRLVTWTCLANDDADYALGEVGVGDMPSQLAGTTGFLCHCSL